MLIPGKYEDVRCSPVLIGAWVLQQVKQNDSLHALFESAIAQGHNEVPGYSATDVTLGLTFLYAWGLISVNDMRVVVHEIS